MSYTYQLGKIEFSPAYPSEGWPYPAAPGITPTVEVRFPHKCPVCNGSGRVQSTIYQDAHSELGFPVFDEVTKETLVYCRSCKGEGVVWG